MKKIAIITFQRTCNYGAALQCFALKKTLENLGNDVTVIDYRNKKIEKAYKLFNGNVKDLFFIRSKIKKIKEFKKFNNKYLNFSRQYTKISELVKNKENFDIYITGSDQVWNPFIANGLEDFYTLNFKNNAKRASYAASMGIDTIPENLVEEYKNKISNLDFISVREEKAKIELDKIIYNKDIEVVLDPTFLLNKNEWNKLKPKRILEDKYILIYTVKEDINLINIAEEQAKKMNCKIVHFRKTNKKFKNSSPINFSSVGPSDFISAINNAEMVFTNSFHGTAFSINLNKEFFCLLPKGTSSRILSILKKLNLEDRVISSKNEFENIKPIDYDIVNKKLEIERQKSIDFLKKVMK